MSALHVRAFSEADAGAWDAFCAASVNGTFLHTRRFLSYHGDRFADCSCIVERDGRWVGVLPAAAAPDDARCALSHPGATFGGLVHGGALAGADAIEALARIARHLCAAGFTALRYRAVPHLYHGVPAQDDLYGLFRLGAQRYRCDLSCAVDLESGAAPASRRERGVRKAHKAGVSVRAGVEQLAEFWPVLLENLARRHDARPVHSLAEMSLLMGRFPQAIELVCARLDGAVVGGTLLFVHPRVVHAQYIAASAAGHEVGALDAVFAFAIAHARGRARYFDFGISNEDEGRRLNAGLYGFKREFGGGGAVHEHFALDLERAAAAQSAD
jgi:hypothetical protein